MKPRLLAVLFVICSILPCQGQEYRVGVLLPLSGQTAYAGEACRNGTVLAMESLAPAVRRRVQVVFEDDQMEPRRTLSGYQKIRSEGVLTAVLNLSSGTSNALAPITEEAHIPLIAMASDPKVVQGRRYAVNYWVTPEEEARELNAELQRRKIRKIAVVTGNHAAFMTFKREFLKRAGGDVEIVLDEDFDPAEMDFRTVLARLKSLGDFDGVFVNLFFGQVGPFARQARSLGIMVPLFGIESFEDEKEVSASGGALVGQWYVQADDAASDFLRIYHERFPRASTFMAANCYDAILLIGRANEAQLDREGLNDFLHEVRGFKGAFGSVSATGDNRFDLKAVVKKVTPNGFERQP